MRTTIPGFFLFLGSLAAQTLAITAPSSNQSLSGYRGFSFAVSYTGTRPAVVEYIVDAYSVGISRDPQLSMPWNTFSVLNGQHQVRATSFDALGNMLASAAPISFVVSNPFWNGGWTPSFSVSTGTSLSSPWTAVVSITGTVSGTQSSDGKTFHLYVDGSEIQSSGNITAASWAASIDTSRYSNSNHVVALRVSDNSAGRVDCTAAGLGGVQSFGGAGEWSASVLFSNSNKPNQLILSASELYLAPGATATLNGTIVNADNSTTPASPVFYSKNTAVATVGQTTGLVSAVSNGSAELRAMAPVFSGSDLHLVTPSQVTSAARPFTSLDVGGVIQVTSGSGCTVGIYDITSFEPTLPGVNIAGSAGNTGSNCGFKTGPTRSAWALVWPTNVLPHFGNDGSILTSYDPGKSFFLHSVFTSMSGFADQPYLPGFGADYNASGFNNLETGIISTTIDQMSTNQSTFTNNQNSYVATTMGYLFAFPRLTLNLTGDNMTRTSTALYAATRGALAAFNPSAAQIIFNSWKGQPNAVIEASMQDEVNFSWDHKPLQGPITFAGGSQSGLTSIVVNGGVCTVNWTDWSLNGAGSFIITGATTSGFNTAAGALYHRTKIDANTFTFPCASVANGTYNSITDPALTIHPYVAQWFASNSDFIHHDAFKLIRAGALNVPGHALMTWPNAAGTTIASIGNWGTLGTQAIGGVSKLADAVDLYTMVGPQPYLASRYSGPAIVSQFNDKVHSYYGSGFDPTVPFTLLTHGTPSNYGFQGPIVPVASCTGNTITLSAPHEITNVYPGITRLSVAGSSGAGCDGKFYVLSAPSSTTLTVARASTSFSGTGTGGTLTFFNGRVESVGTANASGTIMCSNGICADMLTLGVPDANLASSRGQTFTLSVTGGTAQSQFNTRTFVDVAENTTGRTGIFGFREVPSFAAATGGVASIVPDNYYIRGRNTGLTSDANLGWEFATSINAFILRAAGQRLYRLAEAAQGYDSAHGFYNLDTAWNYTFGDTCNQTVQLWANPHFENGLSVPAFHASSTAARLMNRIRKFALTPTPTQIPDYGPNIPSTMRSGADGSMLMVLNLFDNPRTLTFTLSPYLQGGQKVVRLYATYTGIELQVLPAGSASDTFTLDPQGVVVYLFPTNFEGELQQPTIAANVSDIANASKIAVRYSYDPYWLDQKTSAVDCGTGTCTLPADRGVGSIYYRLLYLDSNKNVLATSDPQVFY